MKTLISLILLSVVMAFSVTIDAELQFRGWPKEIKRLPAMVTITADSTAVTDREPLHVIYVLDVSTSADAPFYDELISGAKVIMERLESKDLFSVVTSAEFARTLVPLTVMSDDNKAKILTQLSSVSKEEGRNLSAAFQRVEKEFALKEGESVANRVAIITTLGSINKGSKGEKLLAEIQKSVKWLPYTIYTFSGGEGFDEDLMISCAEEQNGRAYYSPEESIKTVHPHFVKMATRISNVQMSGVELTLSAGEIVLSAGEIVLSPFQKSERLPETLSLGTLGRGEKRYLFFDLTNRPKDAEALDVDLDYYNLGTKSTLSQTASTEIDLLKKSGDYHTKGVPLITHSILRHLVQSCDDLERGDKDFRSSYAQLFKEKLLYRLESLKSRLGGSELTELSNFLTDLHNDISTGTTDIAIIVKKSKYELHNSRFGR